MPEKILIIMPLELGGERYMISRRLERKGFETIIAGRIDKWVEIARSESVNLILADMTHITSDENKFMLQGFKTIQATKKIPIIAIVEQETFIEKQNVIDIDDYEVRPIYIPRLVEKINRLLSTDEW